MGRLYLTLFAVVAISVLCHGSVFYPEIPENGQEVSVFEANEFKLDFSNRSNFFGPSNNFRARKYLKMARKHFDIAFEAGRKRASAEEHYDRQGDSSFTSTMTDQEQHDAAHRDVFLLVWLASQHINTAVTFGPNMAGVLAEAADLSLGLHSMPGEVSIDVDAALQMVSRSCRLDAPLVAKWLSSRLKYWGANADFNRHDSGRLRKASQNLLKHECGNPGRFEKPPPPESLWEQISNPQAQPPKCAVGQPTTECFPVLNWNYVNLWPTKMATMHVDLPEEFHKALSDLAISRYMQHQTAAKQRDPRITLESINNGFFSLQQDAASKWPELLRSKHVKHLRRILHKVAIDYALKIGNFPQGKATPELTEADLFLWTAVYTEGTPHLTHCHDQGIVSGAYYSQAPDSSAPIVFTDPRGGQPMHIDSAGHAPETEPEAPFSTNAVMFPSMGDLVLFPSWLPHRVPPAKMSGAPRVVWSFNLNGPVNGWARSTAAPVH